MIAKEKNKGGAPVKRRNVPSFSSGARISWADQLGWNAGGFRLERQRQRQRVRLVVEKGPNHMLLQT